MTVLFGFHLKNYIIVAADTRVSYYPPGEPMRWRDGVEKITKTSLGLITGSGLVDLLDPVKARFQDTDVKHTDDVVRVIREEHERIKGRKWYGDTRVQESLKRICWMFTYFGMDDPANINLDTVHLRLGIFHPEFSTEQRGLIPEGKAMVTMPDGSTEEECQAFSEAANAGLKTSDELPGLQESVEYHTKLIAYLVKRISAINEMVSPTFQVGVQTLFNGCGVSGIAGEGLPLDLTVSTERPK